MKCERCGGLLLPGDDPDDRYCLRCGFVLYAEAPLPWRPGETRLPEKRRVR